MLRKDSCRWRRKAVQCLRPNGWHYRPSKMSVDIILKDGDIYFNEHAAPRFLETSWDRPFSWSVVSWLPWRGFICTLNVVPSMARSYIYSRKIWNQMKTDVQCILINIYELTRWTNIDRIGIVYTTINVYYSEISKENGICLTGLAKEAHLDFSDRILYLGFVPFFMCYIVFCSLVSWCLVLVPYFLLLYGIVRPQQNSYSSDLTYWPHCLKSVTVTSL